MTKGGEFRQHWRSLLAASLGVGTALSFNTYLLSIFAPYMIEDFGWSLSDFALTGLVQFVVVVSIPIAGRLTDLYGVRRVAATGAFSYPLFLLAIAAMNGNLGVYLAIYILQTLICSTTTMTVYSRVVAGAFSARRGLALGICGSAPPLLGMVASPVMSAFVADHGWRSGYVVVAAFCMACSVATFLLLRGGEAAREAEPIKPPSKRQPGDYRAILASPVFWILVGALLLVNTPFAMANAQLKLIALDQGMSDGTAALMVSVFAGSSIAGRVLAGTALDKLPAHIIAALAFFLPVIGLLLLASPYDSTAPVMTGLVLIGLSFGGEGDIIPYLVTRFFKLEVYGTVLGLLTAAMGGAMAIGTGLLSLTLRHSNDYQLYFLTAAATALFGSAMFLLLGLGRFQPRGTTQGEPVPA
jgi:MFS family permease